MFVLVMSMLTLATGLTAPDMVRDVDQIVYENTLHRMQEGQGYYPAMRQALIEKDGLPPTQVRSFRTPLVLATLRWFPESGWRVIASLFLGATIALCAALAHPFGRHGSTIAAVLAGFWAIGYAPLLYLHSEIWALPLALGGLLLARRAVDQVSPGALALLAGATFIRELFGLLFVLVLLNGLVDRSGLRRDRLKRWREVWPRLAASGALVSGLGLHALAASPHLSEAGYEPPFGNEGMKPAFLAAAVGPGDSALSLTLGLTGLILGAIGLRRVRRTDPVAGSVAVHSLVLLGLTLTIGRSYWGYVIGPLLATYLPAAFAPRTIDRAAERAAPGVIGRQIGDERGEPLTPFTIGPTRTR